MDELAAILARWRAAGPRLPDAVLATVVHVRGSAYRRPGARMLIASDGTRIGTVSGGCLETELVRKSWWWTDGGPVVRVFDGTTDDAVRDFGLGCNGVVTVLLERATAPSPTRLLAFLDRHRRARAGVVVATVIATSGDAAVGDRLLVGPDGTVEHDDDPRASAALADAVRATFDERASRLAHLDDTDVFVEWVGPPMRLFVFGAGHDAMPLVALARVLGWEVTVADARPNRLDPSRFPGAAAFDLPASATVADLCIGPDDAVVLMTHNYPRDARLLPQLVAAAPRYLGLLGPRHRAEKLFAEIGGDVAAPNVYAPVGLDIGAHHPETIALAIVAEVQAVLARRAGGQLRTLPGAIHAPPLEIARALDDVDPPLAAAV